METGQIIINKFWDGREGIIPWCCFYDPDRNYIYPLVYSEMRSFDVIYPADKYRTIIQVEDVSRNLLFLVADRDGFGTLFDKNGNFFPQQEVKRFVILRNQAMTKPALVVLAKVNNTMKIFHKEFDEDRPFIGNVYDLPSAQHTFYDISKYKNYLLILELVPDLQAKLKTLLWWSKLNINYNTQLSGLWEEPNPLTFPEFFIILPPSNFHFIWENHMLTSEGYYQIYETEIGGYFSLLYEKIFNLSVPNEFGGGSGLDDIRMGYQIFRDGFAVSIRGKTFLFQKGIEELNQTSVDTHIAPLSPLLVRRVGMKHTLFPFFAIPEDWKVFITDNYVLLLSHEQPINSNQKKRTIYIFEKAEKAHGIVGEAYIVLTADPTKMKHLRKMAPLRFYEHYIITGTPKKIEEIGMRRPNFLNLNPQLPNHFLITEHNYEAEVKWIQTRDTGNAFLINFEVFQSIQSLFEFQISYAR